MPNVLYCPNAGPVPSNSYWPSIGPVLCRYCKTVPGQNWASTNRYWVNTGNLFWYWPCTVPIPDVLYWLNTGRVQTHRYWPSIGPALGLHWADIVKRCRANTNTVCKTAPGQYWHWVLSQYRQRYWASIGPVP